MMSLLSIYDFCGGHWLIGCLLTSLLEQFALTMSSADINSFDQNRRKICLGNKVKWKKIIGRSNSVKEDVSLNIFFKTGSITLCLCHKYMHEYRKVLRDIKFKYYSSVISCE